MKAMKENKVYSLNTDAEVKEYRAKGYDIYDDNGNLKENAIGKSVPFDDYEVLKKENAALKKKVKAYEKASKEDNAKG